MEGADDATLQRKIDEKKQTHALLLSMGEAEGARMLQEEIDQLSAALAGQQARPAAAQVAVPVAVPIAVPTGAPAAMPPAPQPVPQPVPAPAPQPRVLTEEEQIAAALEASQASHSAQSARAALEQANEEAQLARVIAESQATAGHDLARRQEEADRLEAEAAGRFREAEEAAEAERAALAEESRRAAEENRRRAEAELQQRQQEQLAAQEQREATAAAAAAAQAEAERQAAEVAAAAAARDAALQAELDAEAVAYIRQLHEAGTQAGAPGPSMATDLQKAEKYYDKADQLAAGTSVEQLGQAYLNYLRYVTMVMSTLPSHEGWEGSDQQRVAKKKGAICVKKLEKVKPLVVQAFKAGKLAGGGGAGAS
jgi:DNA repair exonuclease SbcCD ATPase subunit